MGQIFSNDLEQVSTIRTATLDSIMKRNAELREKIVEAKLEESSEGDRNLVLDSVIHDVLWENQALQNELQRVKSQNGKGSKSEGKKCVRKEKNVTPEDEGLDDGDVEIDRVFKMAEQHIALISGKIRYLHEQYEGLEKCDALTARIRNYEMYQAKLRKLQDVIQTLRTQNDNLQERFECLGPIQEVHKERFAKIEAEKNALIMEKLELERQFNSLVREIAQESRYSRMFESVMIKKKAFERENRRKKEHLRDLTEKYDVLKTTEFEYKQKVMGVEELKMENNSLQQKINKMEMKCIELKANKMVFRHIDNEEATAMAVNKKLLKRKQKLEKELQKFENCEAKIEEIIHGMSELKNENCNLYKEVVALEVHIKKIELQKTHEKSLKKEEESLKSSNKKLMFDIEKLNRLFKPEIANMYTICNNKLKDKLIDVQQINDYLNAQYEDAFMLMYKPAHLDMFYEQLRGQLIALKEFNHKYASEINEMTEMANKEAGPSVSG